MKFFGRNFVSLLLISIASNGYFASKAHSQMGFGGGMFGVGSYDDGHDAVSPMLKDVISSTDAISQKILAAQTDMTAIKMNRDVIRARLREKELERTTARKTADVAKMNTLDAEYDLLVQASEQSDRDVATKEKQIGQLQKQQDKAWSTSRGWILADSSEKKELAGKNHFSCGTEHRMVERQGFGVYEWACLDSKGYMSKRAVRSIGTASYDTDTTYERENGKLKRAVVRKGDKVVMEQDFMSTETRTKYYQDGKIQTSCSVYGDEKSRRSESPAALRGATTR